MPENNLNIYPQPKHFRVSGSRIQNRSIRISAETETIQKFRVNIDLIGEGTKELNVVEFKLVLKKFDSLYLREFEIADDFNRSEAYGIEINNNTIVVYGDSDRAYFYGIITLKAILDANEIHENILILDYPHMKIRGIIEGFYGKPWTLEQRLGAITTISSHKMNAYIYAPKDDPYHREKWNIPYPQEQLSNIRKLYEHCEKNFVDFYYTVGPGLSISYSDEKDFEALLQKYMQMYKLGIRNFGILFDDIPSRLLNKEDIEKFEGLSEAHAYIVNRMYNRLKELDCNIRLIVCGTVYYGRGNERYIINLGKSIPADVNIFWTGRSICSQELDSRDASFFYENTEHQPLYWDNYPVNDSNMQYELHIGPLTGRDKDLHRYSEGLVSNLMEYKESSMIPVITVCHYLWDCESYNSELSLTAAVKEIAGEKDYEQFIKFDRYCLKSCLNPAGSEEFIEKAIDFKYWANKDKDNFLRVLEGLVRYFEGNTEASVHLLKNMNNKELLAEVKPWLKKFKEFNIFCTLMIKCIIFSKNGKKRAAAVSGIKALLIYKKLNRNPIQMMSFEAQVLIQSCKV